MRRIIIYLFFLVVLMFNISARPITVELGNLLMENPDAVAPPQDTKPLQLPVYHQIVPALEASGNSESRPCLKDWMLHENRPGNHGIICHPRLPGVQASGGSHSAKNIKRMKSADKSGSTNQGSSGEQQNREEDPNNDGNNAGSQVATDTKDQPNDDGKECYFKHERRNERWEKEPRPKESVVSSGCSGGLRSFEELAKTKPEERYDAQNNADLALIRGAAEFDNDFNDEEVKERMKNIFICKKHEDELVFNWWKNKDPTHVKERNTGLTRKPLCGVPNNLLTKHGSNSASVLAGLRLYLRKDAAYAFLRQTGAHLHVGIPMCQAHAVHINDWITMTSVKARGMQIIPAVDFAGAASIENPKSVYSKDSSAQEAYCESLAAGPSGLSARYQPPERASVKEPQSDPAITEEVKTKLREFLNVIGVERLTLKSENKPFNELSRQTKRKKAYGCRKIRQIVYKIAAPGDEEQLEEMDCKKYSDEVWSSESSKQLKELMEAIVEQYEESFNSGDRADRRALLSLVAPIMPFAQLQKFIPGLTYYRFTEARNLARGMGKPIAEVEVGQREKYSPGKVSQFVDFITSEHVMMGLPYGSIAAKTSSGEKIKIANTLRRYRHEHIVKLYQRHLEGLYGPNHDKGISRSAMLEILNACSARRRKAIAGLDEYIANGRDAFDYIYEMLDTMLEREYEDSAFVEVAKRQLKESHQYLETDYKLHVKEVSRVGDHCIRHSLSDPKDSNFNQSCEAHGFPDSHKHDMVCDRCEQLRDILGEIRDHVTNYNLPRLEKDRFKSRYFAAEKAIYDMRRHQLRSVHSTNTRIEIVEQLGEREWSVDALLTLDWAMNHKFLARERQTDFFGKKGVSWHITHVIRRDQDKKLQQRTLVHVIEEEIQGSDAVLAIIRHVLQDLKNFGVNSVILRSDNAACYHNANVLASIHQISNEEDVSIVRYAFSEAQSGKSACDRMAAVVKRQLHDYIDQGHNVETALDFIKAIDSAITVNGIAVFAAKVINSEKDRKAGKATIQDISFYGDIFFHNFGIQVFKYTGIGSGKEIKKKDWEGKESKAKLEIFGENRHPPGNPTFDWAPLHCTRHIVQPDEVQQECEEDLEEMERQEQCSQSGTYSSTDTADEEDVLPEEQKEDYYDCPEPNCIAQFSKFGYLQRHVITGEHKYVKERKTMRDFALHNFQVNVAGRAENEIRLQEPIEEVLKDLRQLKDTNSKPTEGGWAMKKSKERTRFSDKRREYLDKAFNQGVKNRNAKVDAKKLAKEMDAAIDPNTNLPLFNANELLTATQIASYFSVKARKLREKQDVKTPEPLERALETLTVNEEELNSEGDIELDAAEDPMFYSVEDEIAEKVAQTAINDGTIEDISEPQPVHEPSLPETETATKRYNTRQGAQKYKHDEFL